MGVTIVLYHCWLVICLLCDIAWRITSINDYNVMIIDILYLLFNCAQLLIGFLQCIILWSMFLWQITFFPLCMLLLIPLSLPDYEEFALLYTSIVSLIITVSLATYFVKFASSMYLIKQYNKRQATDHYAALC